MREPGPFYGRHKDHYNHSVAGASVVVPSDKTHLSATRQSATKNDICIRFWSGSFQVDPCPNDLLYLILDREQSICDVRSGGFVGLSGGR